MKLSRTQLLQSCLKSFWGYYLFCLLLLTLSRLLFGFIFLDGSIFSERFSEIVMAFWVGFKFDTIVISYTFVPFLFIHFVLWLIPLPFAYYIINKMTRWWMWVMSFVVLMLVIFDLGFYSYFQERMNYLVFGFLEDDTTAVMISIWKNYPLFWAILGIVIYCFMTFKLMRRLFVPAPLLTSYQFKQKRHYPFVIQIVLVAIHLVLAAIGIRGTVSIYALEPKYTDFSSQKILNDMSLNGAVTLDKAIRARFERYHEKRSMAQIYGVTNINESFSYFLGFKTDLTNPDDLVKMLWRKTSSESLFYQAMPVELRDKKPHVIVVIMESMGAYWLRYQSEKFDLLGSLKNSFENDLLFPGMVSGDNGTIGSMLTITSNMPPLPGLPYLSEGIKKVQKFDSMAHLPFHERGYESLMLYGGKLSWRNIGSFYAHQGFSKVEGENHIKEYLKEKLPQKYGSLTATEWVKEWGVYDEFLFDYLYEKLSQAKRPQFVVVLTTTNHPPFEVPVNYQKKIDELKPLQMPQELLSRVTRGLKEMNQRFVAYRYSSDMYGEFLAKIKNSQLQDRSILAMTGDHNFWGYMNYENKEHFQKYEVPFLLTTPIPLKKFVDGIVKTNFENKKRLSSHLDLMTTLYHLSLNSTDYLSFGKNLLSFDEDHFVYNTSFLASAHGVLDIEEKFYPWANDDYQNYDVALPLNEKNQESLQLEAYRKALYIVTDEFLNL